MDITALKASIFQKIDSVDEVSTLDQINVLLKEILSSTPKDILDELSSAQYERLKLAKQQVKDGKTISHEAVKKQTKEWFMK